MSVAGSRPSALTSRRGQFLVWDELHSALGAVSRAVLTNLGMHRAREFDIRRSCIVSLHRARVVVVRHVVSVHVSAHLVSMRFFCIGRGGPVEWHRLSRRLPRQGPRHLEGAFARLRARGAQRRWALASFLGAGRENRQQGNGGKQTEETSPRSGEAHVGTKTRNRGCRSFMTVAAQSYRRIRKPQCGWHSYRKRLACHHSRRRRDCAYLTFTGKRGG